MATEDVSWSFTKGRCMLPVSTALCNGSRQSFRSRALLVGPGSSPVAAGGERQTGRLASHRMKLFTCVVVSAVVFSGCSSSDDGAATVATSEAVTLTPTSSNAVGTLPATSPTPLCSEALAVRATVTDEAADGCTQQSGGQLRGYAFDCGDGRRLVQVDVDGPPRWGFTGDVVHETTTPEIADDPAYADAYAECNG